MSHKKTGFVPPEFDETYNFYRERLYSCGISGTIIESFVRPVGTNVYESGDSR